MKVVSINVGLPREVEWRGEVVTTSIFKEPVAGRVRVKQLNLDGDKQSDLSVHGGAAKAVYAYPSEHYEFWRREIPDVELHWGAFGENFTTTGLLENAIQIGDRIRIGTAEFMVTQPRKPCFKLGIRLNRADIVRRFLQSGRTGFYLSVCQEGAVTAGDDIVVAPTEEATVTVHDIVRLYTSDATDQAMMRRASQLSALPEGWRKHFRERLPPSDAKQQ